MVQDVDSNALHPFDFSQISQEIPELNKLNCEIETIAFDVPIDSSDICPNDWNRLANAIKENYQKFDGFIDILSFFRDIFNNRYFKSIIEFHG